MQKVHEKITKTEIYGMWSSPMVKSISGKIATSIDFQRCLVFHLNASATPKHQEST
jgi:hypothetical protein